MSEHTSGGVGDASCGATCKGSRQSRGGDVAGTTTSPTATGTTARGMEAARSCVRPRVGRGRQLGSQLGSLYCELSTHSPAYGQTRTGRRRALKGGACGRLSTKLSLGLSRSVCADNCADTVKWAANVRAPLTSSRIASVPETARFFLTRLLRCPLLCPDLGVVARRPLAPAADMSMSQNLPLLTTG